MQPVIFFLLLTVIRVINRFCKYFTLHSQKYAYTLIFFLIEFISNSTLEKNNVRTYKARPFHSKVVGMLKTNTISKSIMTSNTKTKKQQVFLLGLRYY